MLVPLVNVNVRHCSDLHLICLLYNFSSTELYCNNSNEDRHSVSSGKWTSSLSLPKTTVQTTTNFHSRV